MNAGTSQRRVAYWSPLPPQRSGIADYSLELLSDLVTLCDVEVFADEASVRARRASWPFPLFPVTAYEGQHAEAPFDLNIYHMRSA